MLGRQVGSSLLRLPIRARLVLRPTAPFQSTCSQDATSRALFFSFQRSYATPGRPRKAVGEPSKPVKRAVKRQARSSTKSDPASKQVKGKKKSATGRPKKKAAPKKPAKKVLTEEQKAKKAEKAEKTKIRELKATALSPPRSYAHSAYQTFIAEKTKGSSGKASERLSEASREWKAITPAQQEHYNHLAQQATQEDQAAFKKWVESRSPEEIKQANNARAQLRRKLVTTARSSKYKPIPDERAPKKPANAYALFNVNRQNSGDFKNIPFGERAKLISREWSGLSQSEKQKYKDLSSEDLTRYSSEHKSAFGYVPPFINGNVAAAAAA